MNGRFVSSAVTSLCAGRAAAATRSVGRCALRLANLLLRNRVAIGLASLAWLVFRSGSQPRRLSYPCQQAAAANVGGWAVALVPGAFVRGRRRR